MYCKSMISFVIVCFRLFKRSFTFGVGLGGAGAVSGEVGMEVERGKGVRGGVGRNIS